MTSRKVDLRVKEIPEIVVDPKTRKKYRKGKFLGKGGFAKCYQLTDMETNLVYAGKIVSKALLVKPHQREKMSQEIEIHKTISHPHIVGFHHFFEDSDNVYILLELCCRRSMMELHKRRRAITEPECRYFVRQIATACDYLHKHNIIHRDLKLGNLFLNDSMEIKIGDFGLATRVGFEGERKRTMCGTPNYIAPEVLGKKGHSFEVDAWSLGCIIYTMLVGKPPFETSCLKDTYSRIQSNEYHIPVHRASAPAKSLIQRLLQANPSARPSMDSILADEFFTAGYLPPGLPTSCLTMAPHFNSTKPTVEESRKPLIDINSTAATGTVSSRLQAINKKAEAEVKPSVDSDEPADCYLSEINTMLMAVLASKPSERASLRGDDLLDPAAVPIYWISKWVDYSDKYGLGYQLCDNSFGVLFNDSTRLILASHNTDNSKMQYIERDGKEHFHSLKDFPETLSKKVTLLKYFRNYMSEHLLKAGANITAREGDELTRLPFLRTWFRTRSAIVLHLSNGTLQVNFFQDHTKIILCPLMGAVTYIDARRDFRTYTFKSIETNGCSKELCSRLKYAQTMTERLLASKSGGSARGRAVNSATPSSAATVRP